MTLDGRGLSMVGRYWNTLDYLSRFVSGSVFVSVCNDTILKLCLLSPNRDIMVLLCLLWVSFVRDISYLCAREIRVPRTLHSTTTLRPVLSVFSVLVQFPR